MKPRALIAGVVLGGSLVAGGLLMQSGAWREAGAAGASSPAATARLLDEVMSRIGADYIDTLSRDEMLRRSAVGVVKELGDPYSVLLTPERYKQLGETTTGRYPGVGLALDLRDEVVTVIAALIGTPADSAGIVSGDHILAVDGKPTRGLTMEEVQRQLRGVAGTKVKLSVERLGDRRDVTLTRRVIVYHPVQRAQVAGSVGYVQLATFSEDAAAEVRRAVDSLRARGARSLILDLRANPGGLLEQGIEVSDLFLDRGKSIVSTHGRTAEADRVFRDETAQRWADMPMIALVDSGTASASEIVAGALQDNDRAVLVGARTYGKGSAQSVFPVSGGYGLKLTTARWFTPGGRTIARDSTSGGITPDVFVPDTAVKGVPVRTDTLNKMPGEPATRTFRVGARSTWQDPVVVRAVQLLEGAASPAALRSRVPRKK
ncbi:MAG TPA: S41 family peptidase [Gemmatimonadaceae bacterium]|nr:S41 family peptidase [Gemmatimonadaceae bacterium]